MKYKGKLTYELDNNDIKLLSKHLPIVTKHRLGCFIIEITYSPSSKEYNICFFDECVFSNEDLELLGILDKVKHLFFLEDKYYIIITSNVVKVINMDKCSLSLVDKPNKPQKEFIDVFGLKYPLFKINKI
jgi:hypothetical protein